MKVPGSEMAVYVVSVRRRATSPRGWLGLIALILALAPWPAGAVESWTDGRQFGLETAAADNTMPSATAEQVVAALTPGSVLIAQAGDSAEPPADEVRFRVTPEIG